MTALIRDPARDLIPYCPPAAPLDDWLLSWTEAGLSIWQALAWCRAGLTDAGRAADLRRAGVRPEQLARDCACGDRLVDCIAGLDADEVLGMVARVREVEG